MNQAIAPLAVVLAEALALWRDLDGASTPDPRMAARAARLVAAAETCCRALAAGELSPAPAVDRRAAPPADRGRTQGRRAGRWALSAREAEVLGLLAAGYRDRQIAEALVVSRRTVTTHVTSILNKLGAESRTAAVAQAIRRGLV